MKLSLIVALDPSTNGIGINNKLPWKVPIDLKYFKATTLNSTIIMGRNTWESIGSKPLKNRNNLVISKSFEYKSLQDALDSSPPPPIYVIGGSRLYQEALQHPEMETLFITHITPTKRVEYDTFFPQIPPSFQFCPETTKSHLESVNFDSRYELDDCIVEFKVYKKV